MADFVRLVVAMVTAVLGSVGMTEPVKVAAATDVASTSLPVGSKLEVRAFDPPAEALRVTFRA